MSKHNRAAVVEAEEVIVSEQQTPQPEEQPAVEGTDWNAQPDSKIIKEMERLIKDGGDKDNTSGRIRTLGRMGVKIKKIKDLLKLNQFQHAYVVLRKAGLVTPVPRTQVGTCKACGKPIYTQESLEAGLGTLCRHQAASQENNELEEAS